ncbi:MAG: hypothetical protein VW879_07650 [Opitutae bacterium]
MQISESPKTKYYVQFYSMSDKKWLTHDKYEYYVDAIVSETAIEVPSIDTEKME